MESLPCLPHVLPQIEKEFEMPQHAGLVPSLGDLDFIPPVRLGRASMRCECCGERKPASDFEEDCLGICTPCVESDVVILAWDTIDAESTAPLS